jgi:O-antigen biosynthesis protein
MKSRSQDEEIARLRALLDERNARIACQTDRIDALLASSSWRVTRPLRAGALAWRKLSAALRSLTGAGSNYGRWIKRYDTLDAPTRRRLHDEADALARRPRISVIMPVYDPDPAHLDETIRSVRNQIYGDWELCLADDASKNPAVHRVLERHAAEEPRIKTVYRGENGHISRASNSALALAGGEFIALLDHDDLLPAHALLLVARTIAEHPDAVLIYSDEDKITPSGRRHDPYFKCEFNRELLLTQNMISHLGVYRRDLVMELGGFREGLEGSQDWDLALRVVNRVTSDRIVHIPRVLYHWRTSPGSTAATMEAKGYAREAGRKAVADHLREAGVSAEVTSAPEIPSANRVRYTLPAPPPLVTLLVPTRDRGDVLRRCLASVLEKTRYAPFEILVLDNDTAEPETVAYLRDMADPRVRVLPTSGPFNFSALNNEGARRAAGEVLVLLNNDVEVLNAGWLDELVSVAMQPGVGAVGARLWYPGGLGLQHGGVLLGIGPVAGHAHRRLRRGQPGYFGRALLRQEFSAVTAACLAVRKRLYVEAGGLDEQLPVTGNDVDFCLRLREAGHRNIWTPYAELIHHESVSRGTDDTPEKHIRAAMEQKLMRERWRRWLEADPAHNPNLTVAETDFSLAWPPRTSPL